MPDPDLSRPPDGMLISELDPAPLTRRQIHHMIPKDNNLGARGLRGIVVKKKSEVGIQTVTFQFAWSFRNREHIFESLPQGKRGCGTGCLPGHRSCLKQYCNQNKGEGFQKIIQN